MTEETELIRLLKTDRAGQDLPSIFQRLIAHISPESLECLAYCKYHLKLDVPEVQLPSDFDFSKFRRNKESTNVTTSAGFAKIGGNQAAPVKSSGISSQPWLIEYFINTTTHIDEWWPLVIPALLNYLDTTDLEVRKDAVRLVTQLASIHGPKMLTTGLVPIFEGGVEPLLSFLPPMVEPEVTMSVHRTTVECLAQLAKLQSQPARNSRLNFVALNGVLKPFAHTTSQVKLLIYCCHTLTQFIDTSLQSLTVIHFHSIVRVFNQIMADPFVDFSPDLINACLDMMVHTMKWAWPVVDKYRLDIMFGLAKANCLDSQCFQMLDPTENEIERLKQARRDTMV